MKRAGEMCVLFICLCVLFAVGGVSSGAWAGKLTTAERHKEYGIDCAGCHGANEKKLFDHKQCLGCHESYVKVAERTRKLERNPHKSHYGEVECIACHQGHKADESLCAQCH